MLPGLNSTQCFKINLIKNEINSYPKENLTETEKNDTVSSRAGSFQQFYCKEITIEVFDTVKEEEAGRNIKC